jgi:UDP-glucose 4-epimerase
VTTWVIGRGGLFGSALVRNSTTSFNAQPIPWNDTNAAARALTANLHAFASTAANRWCIAWAAGRATTSSTREDTEREQTLFRVFTQELAEHPPAGRGVFLLTSSAGGLYAGSQHPPFDRTSLPHPISEYGFLKQSQEHIATDLLTPSMSVVIARVSNLYGPGQDLAKLQGLISRLALAAITKRPVTIFVPLDTLRDYIDVDDAAVRALHWVDHAHGSQPSSQVRVIASGESVTVARVISLMHDVARVRIPVAYGLVESAGGHAYDLRLIPDVDSSIANLPLTPLPVGMKQVYLDLLTRHASARIAN